MREWLFNDTDGSIVSDDQVERLTAKASKVLSLLVSRKGEVVPRDQILLEVWQGLNVTPDLVREYIFDIRSALGDDARSPKYIETVRGKGFRLLAGVSFADQSRRDARQPRPRVAVLRPDQFGGDDRWRQFADALAEELTTDLARFVDLAVINRHSSFACSKMKDLKDVAASLSADFLLTSSVIVGVEQIRVSFQLIDGTSGTLVSTQRLERPPSDLPVLTSEIAARITAALGGLRGEIQAALRSKVLRRPAAT